jgi:hypothetical protein
MADNGIIDKNEKLDFSKIMHDLYHLNLLIYNSYIIFKKKVSNEKKIELLMKLEDGDGNKFIDKSLAERVLNNYSKSIIKFYDSFKNTNVKLVNLNDATPNKIQNGGYVNQKFYEDNFIDRSLTNPEFIYNAKEIVNTPIIQEYIQKFNIFNPINAIKLGFNVVSFAGDAFIYGLNWVFFPLYQMENLPIVGGLISIPLDIIGVMIDNSGFIMNFFGPIIPIIITIILNIGAAIPIPGVNTFFAGLSTANVLASKPLEWLLEHFLDLLSMFFNISRKQWGLAYTSAMEIFPTFAKMVDVTVTNLYTINKVLNRGNNFIEGMANTVDVVAPLATTYLFNPSMIFKPMTVFKNVILPRKNKIPIIKHMPLELLFSAPETMKRISSQISQISDVNNYKTYKVNKQNRK